MQYRVTIEGNSPLIMHDVIGGMDPTSPANKEKAGITAKRGSNRTEADDVRLRELETLTSLWFTVRNEFGIPERSLRAMIEGAARITRQGAQVRQGLRVLEAHFDYDRERYGNSVEDLARSAQFTTPVKVQRSTINRTRAKIDCPWSCRFVVDTAEDLVDQDQLTGWIRAGGRRLGLGDWRPEKSGSYGMFDLVDVEVLEE